MIPPLVAARWRWALLVGSVAFLVYAPSLRNGYTLDDVSAVQEDERLRSGSALALVIAPYLHDVPAARSPYRPVTTLSYALCWRLAGGDAWAFHLFNVTAHVAATLLAWLLLLRLGAPSALAGPTALLFAVHPVHVEAVANVVGRADVLATVFTLLGVLVHLSSRIPPWARVVGVSLAYLLAVGAKENGYVLPLLILLVEVLRPHEAEAVSWRLAARRAIGAWPVLAGMAATLAVYLLLRRSVLGAVVHLDVAAYIAALPTWLRLTTAAANITEVARLLLFPADLSWHYGPAVLMPAGPGDLRFWTGVATLGAAVLLTAHAVREDRAAPAGRWAATGILWIALAFLLLSNLVVPMPTWLAERTLYLPSVGVTLLAVAALESTSRRGAAWRRGAFAVLTALTVLGAIRSWQYSRVWQSNDTLFADLAERHSESFQAARWIGQRMVEAGQVERGLAWFERAVDLNPSFVLVRLDYARALLLAGRAAQAEEVLRPIPLSLHPSASVYLAQSLIMRGRDADASSVVEEGLRSFPSDERLLEQRRRLGGG